VFEVTGAVGRVLRVDQENGWACDDMVMVSASTPGGVVSHHPTLLPQTLQLACRLLLAPGAHLIPEDLARHEELRKQHPANEDPAEQDPSDERPAASEMKLDEQDERHDKERPEQERQPR
jgi:hypothetical protein